jgi:hypothetical protein
MLSLYVYLRHVLTIQFIGLSTSNCWTCSDRKVPSCCSLNKLLLSCPQKPHHALADIENTLVRFHKLCEIFHECDVVPDGFSLPRQHSLAHYPFLITQFGAPNGLCSLITESKHIKAVKHPYRRLNCNKPLGQMLVTNQQLDKLAAVRIKISSKDPLDGPSVVGPLLDLVHSRYGDPPEDDPVPPISPEISMSPPPA